MEIEQIEDKIDHNLYSRQIGAFGVKTMSKLVKMRVLVVGVSGVGLELCKNLILSGPKSVGIYDDRLVNQSDKEFNYYHNSQDEGVKTRSESILNNLQQLNSYVDVHEVKVDNFQNLMSDEMINKYDIYVVTDLYPLNLIYQLNSTLKSKDKAMIVTATLGMMGFVFTDFGNNHSIVDINGEPLKTALITSITDEGLVTTEEKKRHDLSSGDMIKIREVVGMEGINEQTFEVEDVKSGFSFTLKNFDKKYSGYIRNGYFEEVKRVVNVSYQNLQQVLENPISDLIDCDMDYTNMDRVGQLKVILLSIWKYISLKGLPDYYSNSKEFEEQLRSDLQVSIDRLEEEINKDKNEKISKKEWLKILDQDLYKMIFGLSKGTYSPVCSFFGGIAAQEIVKLTGKFTPIPNIFIHEFYSGLLKKQSYEEFSHNKNILNKYYDSRYLSHIALMGESFNKFQNQQILMVGSGALGCEYIKMFSMMGICCVEGSELVVVDDDQIEVSNLNRQFLFRKHHVRQSKSETSVKIGKTFNSEFRAKAIQKRMQPSTENIFTDQFWDNLSFIVNAVDNIKARRYVDSKAVLHKKPLFESGTLGTKSNSQLILPDKTECYSDSQDPPEKGIPECTMRSFPYLINHCIEWARSKFFEIFVRTSTLLSEYKKDSVKAQENIKKRIKNDLPEMLEIHPYIMMFLKLIKKPSLNEYIDISINLYQEYYDTKIVELLNLFPQDYVDKDGKLFWTSPKRPPTAIPFDKDNSDHINFVISCVKILNSIIPLNKNINNDTIEQYIKKMKITRKKPITNTLNKDKVLKEQKDQEQGSDEDKNKIIKMGELIKDTIDNNSQLNITSIEFEKDDDSNGHIDCITYLSNFRAMNYSIEIAPRHKIKMIAGKIIPAIATTTAMVCGTVGIEIYKYFFNLEIEQMRNFFSNLSINLFQFSEPFPPLVQKDKDYDVVMMGPIKTIPKNWNTWSRLVVKGPKTLQEMIDEIKSQYKFNVSSIILKNIQVWTSYTQHDNYRLSMSIREILKELEMTPYEGQKYVVLSLGGEDEEGVDIYPPYLVYHL